VIGGGIKFRARGTRRCRANVTGFCYRAGVEKGGKTIAKARKGENTKKAAPGNKKGAGQFGKARPVTSPWFWRGFL
jgi:hypothetical protein